jgi:hypothetical protein
MNRPEKRTLERVRYWQGQMLRSKDFADLEAVESQRRWWHNRALHEAYGVREGLVAWEYPAAGPTTAIFVEPGVAYDCFGRELILERPQIVPLPTSGSAGAVGTFSLVIHYHRPCADRGREAVCWTYSGPIGTGTVAFFWKPTALFTPTDGVSLGEVTTTLVKNQVVATLDPRFVPTASRAVARPMLASGTTIPGNTPWELWTYGLRQTPIGVQTKIDTSAAGFVDRPVYFAWLQGSIWMPQTLELVPALFPSIADDTVTGFTFRLLLSFPPEDNDIFMSSTVNPVFHFIDANEFPLFARQHDLYVNWLGCQCACVNQQPTLPPGMVPPGPGPGIP